MTEITWTLRTFQISDLTDYAKNPRMLSKEQFAHLKKSMDKFGLIDKPIINADAAHTVIGGHQRLHVLRSEGVKAVECWYPSRELDEREVEELNIRLNKNTGSWEMDILANQWDVGDLLEWGFKGYELGMPEGINDPNAEWKGMPEFNDDGEAIKSIAVHFKTIDDIARFSELIGQKIGDKTHFIWFPERERENRKDKVIVSES